MVLSTLELSSRMRSTEWANISGLTRKITREAGLRTKCMVEVLLYGLMERNMKASLSMIREKDMVFSPGKTAGSIKDPGKTESSTEEEFLLTRINKRSMESGNTDAR